MKTVIKYLSLSTLMLLGTSMIALAAGSDYKAPITTASIKKAINQFSMPAKKNKKSTFISSNVPIEIKPTKKLCEKIEGLFKKECDLPRAGKSRLKDITMNVYLANFTDYPMLNQLLKQTYKTFRPARSVTGRGDLPNDRRVGIDATMVLRNL